MKINKVVVLVVQNTLSLCSKPCQLALICLHSCILFNIHSYFKSYYDIILDCDVSSSNYTGPIIIHDPSSPLPEHHSFILMKLEHRQHFIDCTPKVSFLWLQTSDKRNTSAMIWRNPAHIQLHCVRRRHWREWELSCYYEVLCTHQNLCTQSEESE